MALCKTDLSDFFGWILFLQKCLNFCMCLIQLSIKIFPCIFFWLVCTLFLRKTKTKYRMQQNGTRSFSFMVFASLCWDKGNFFPFFGSSFLKIQALLREKILTQKSHLGQSCFSQNKVQSTPKKHTGLENVILQEWKAQAKIWAFLKVKNFTW